ncbi:hypothetical protein BL253_21990 [Pseudofrankia asymbiotica]|uniref:Uncharacterized protein n=1 Tax=Pseudofrankia asymbiotica TaxID=1834516 RepID=A0A1V2I7I5_9ACTN|nr:hypothetical protein BL253_21990 [Pseudofrankia asymbiotica]
MRIGGAILVVLAFLQVTAVALGVVRPGVLVAIPELMAIVALAWRTRRRERREELALRDGALVHGDPAEPRLVIPVGDIRQLALLRLAQHGRGPEPGLLVVERGSGATPGWVRADAWEEDRLADLLRRTGAPVRRLEEPMTSASAAVRFSGLRLPLAVSDPGLAMAIRNSVAFGVIYMSTQLSAAALDAIL